MAQRYYVVTVTGPAIRWTQIMDSLAPVPGRRQLPSQLLHWRVSVDGSMRLIEAETNDDEHAWMLSQSWVTYIGGRDPNDPTRAEQAVYDYLAANAAAWDRPIGG